MLVNIARYLSLDPESALRKTNRKFKRRFQWMEARLHESGRTADQASMEELESLWQQAKAARETRRGESRDRRLDRLRRCQGLEELRACVALQKEVWNFTDAELVPLRMFVVADKVGGQVMGAFEGKEMVGFALSVPGTRSGHVYLHSHMLAVKKRSSQQRPGPPAEAAAARRRARARHRVDRVDFRSARNQERLSEH